MRLITTADDNLYQAVFVAAKFGRAGKLVDRFQQASEDQWDNAEISFEYALALMATLHTIRSDVDGHQAYHVAMESLGDVLSSAPDHWLARYSRARLRALVPTGFSVYKMFVDHERTMANEDLHRLAECQSAEPWQPYFASTYLLLAFVASHTGDWPAVHGHIEAARAQPAAPVGLAALGAMLCEPFLALHGIVDAADQAAVADLMRTLFPDQPAVTAALHQPTGTGAWRS